MKRLLALAWLCVPLVAAAVPHHSPIILADSIVRLVRAGAIDRGKLEALYASRGGLPRELAEALTKRSDRPVVITRENAAMYVTLLWPLGLANHMEANRKSPINDSGLERFASTGGWTLGREGNGAAYFNRLAVVPLTAGQEALVVRVARQSFRPCCDNSTFYQDCNHGSALLGLLALGASQGLGEEALWHEAEAFNEAWFPSAYALTAIYFKAVRATDWSDVDPRQVLSAAFSSASGWRANVAKPLRERGLAPKASDGDC